MNKNILRYSTFIIKGKKAGNINEVYKILITDLTKTSVMFQNLDKDSLYRMTLDDFHNSYMIIEDLEYNDHSELIKNLMNEK